MPRAKTETVRDALQAAARYWDANEVTLSRRGCNMMPIRAQRCASILGTSSPLTKLGPSDGARLLVGLRESGLGRSSVSNYYAAGRRMLALSGVSTVAWPKAPTPPRKVRPAICPTQVQSLIDWLNAKGWGDTAALAVLMRDTGLRVEVEALNGLWEAGEGRLTVESGKGGHGRVIPYRGPEREPLRASGGITYEGHLRRWKVACRELGISILPHDLRRAFVKRVYEGSGKDLRVAQVLAGHSDPGTTAGYIGVDWSELEGALA